MHVDAERFPTLARLLPIYGHVIEPALLTTFTEWPDNLAAALVEAVTDENERRALLRELVAHAHERRAATLPSGLRQ